MNRHLWILHASGDGGSLGVPNALRHRVEPDGRLGYAWQTPGGVVEICRADDWCEAARYVGYVRVVVATRPPGNPT